LPHANIFHPSPGTFAYTDMTLLEGLIAAPFLWAGVSPVLVYNVMLLGGIVASGLAMFVLVRHLTRDDGAALVGATIFTLAPYRVTHLVHLELQWTMWMPLAFWAVHRIFETGALRFGGLVGLFLSLQLLSSVYYGAFLGIMVAALALMLALWQYERLRGALGPLAIGALLPALTAWLYARPYIENARLLGTRDAGEITTFSATLLSYVTAPYVNWVWGWTGFRFDGDELHLFLGGAAVALAVVGILGRPVQRDAGAPASRRPLAWIYLAMLLLAVELSLGMNGIVYRWLHGTFFAMQGFRAPARFAILAVAALAVLASLGFHIVQAWASRLPLGRAALVIALVLVGVESGSAPKPLDLVPSRTPDLYRYLSTLERGALVEVPFRDLAPVYMYWSKEHWLPLVNGYSGHASPGYTEVVRRLERFPNADSVALLRELDVRYVVVHQSYYPEAHYLKTLLALMQSPDFVSMGRFKDWAGNAEVFAVQPALD